MKNSSDRILEVFLERSTEISYLAKISNLIFLPSTCTVSIAAKRKKHLKLVILINFQVPLTNSQQENVPAAITEKTKQPPKAINTAKLHSAYHLISMLSKQAS